MNIILLGYGKMGKVIEKVAFSRNHEIIARIDKDNYEDLYKVDKSNAVAIEFTQPESAFENVKYCIENQLPVVCGTTGWIDRKPLLEDLCKEKNSAFFYASNYSIGVNLFFQLNRYLAQMMHPYPEYDIKMEEIHHLEKKDAPSGTAITLANDIIQLNGAKTKWIGENQVLTSDKELSIVSLREPNVPGTHSISYSSAIDDIEIKHTAHSREGFATGAVIAAEWLNGRKGVFGMEDLLSLRNK